jgi:hypothetical protein
MWMMTRQCVCLAFFFEELAFLDQPLFFSAGLCLVNDQRQDLKRSAYIPSFMLMFGSYGSVFMLYFCFAGYHIVT